MNRDHYLSWRNIMSGEPGVTFDRIMAQHLQDIRDELRALNERLGCPNFIGIPDTLRSIRRNTARPRRKKARRR